MDNVEELVEWVARKIVGKPQMVESLTNGQWVPDPMHEFDVDGAKDLAKQILSHPDLFIRIDKDTSYEDPWGIWRKRTSPVPVSLAEALKEKA